MPPKRQRTDDDDDDKTKDALMTSPSSSRRRLLSASRGSASKKKSEKAKLVSLFQENCRGLFQQHMERLNTHFQQHTLKQIIQQKKKNHSSFQHEFLYHELLCDTVKHQYKRPTGQVMVCGSKETNSLGPSDLTTSWSPRIVKGLELKKKKNKKWGVNFVTAGGIHNIALTNEGSVYTWGPNDQGYLGRITQNDVEEETPTQVTGFVSSKGENQDYAMISAAAGQAHSLFLSVDGHVYVSGGYMDSGGGGFFRDKDCGKDDKDDDDDKLMEAIYSFHKRPVLIQRGGLVSDDDGQGGAAVMVACSLSTNAVLLRDASTILTWGVGVSGELARDEDMTDKRNAQFKTIDFGSKIPKKPYAPEEPTCSPQDKPQKWKNYQDALHEYNTVELPAYKEELREFDRLFLTPRPATWADQALRPKKTVLHLACGQSHLMVTARCFDTKDDSNVLSLYGSGANQYGQLGMGDEDPRYKLTLVQAMEGKNIAKVACGNHHTLLLDMSGYAIYGMGRMDYGQLGCTDEMPPEGAFENTPIRIAFPELANKEKEEEHRFSQIAAGDNQSFAISYDKTRLYSWGYCDATGSLGHGVETDEYRPRKVNVMRSYPQEDDCLIQMVSGGSQHTVMLVSPNEQENQE